jgi:hypothetical protein
MLVSDLDLRVIAPNGTTTHYPWRLDKNNPSNAATKADNSVDNVEQVVIDAPVTGTYKIRVSHKGTLATAQDFALVTDNAQPVISTLSTLTVTPDTVWSGSPATGTIDFTAPCFFPATVTITDNASNVVTPATATVQEGRATGWFNITTSVTTTDKNVTITATCAGVTRSAMLKLWAPYGILWVSMNKTRVIGGSTPLQGTVKMNHPAPMEGTVNLASDSANMNPPAFVLVNMGSDSATFGIPTTLATTDHVATLTATYGGAIKTRTVTIISPPVLNAVNVPASVKGGNPVTGTVYFNKAAPTSGVLIPVSDNRPEMVTPATALIPGHQWFGDFNCTTTAVTTPVITTVSATYRSVTRTDTITINP